MTDEEIRNSVHSYLHDAMKHMREEYEDLNAVNLVLYVRSYVGYVLEKEMDFTPEVNLEIAGVNVSYSTGYLTKDGVKISVVRSINTNKPVELKVFPLDNIPTIIELGNYIDKNYTGIDVRGMTSLSEQDVLSNTLKVTHYYSEYQVKFHDELKKDGYFKFLKPSGVYLPHMRDPLVYEYVIFNKNKIPYIRNVTTIGSEACPIRNIRELILYLEKEKIEKI